MTNLQRILALFLICCTSQGFSEENYQPDTGDKNLDIALQQINLKNQKKQKWFIKVIANEFQVQNEKVSELFTHYEFTAADVLMTLSIADVTGQPVNNISRAYFENKNSGWQYVLNQLNISLYSREFKRIKKDAEIEFITNRK